MYYADLLKDIRKQRGLTQAELGKKLSLTQSWVSYVESGKMPGRLVRRIIDDYVKFTHFKPTVSCERDASMDLHLVPNSEEMLLKNKEK